MQQTATILFYYKADPGTVYWASVVELLCLKTARLLCVAYESAIVAQNCAKVSELSKYGFHLLPEILYMWNKIPLRRQYCLHR